MAGRRSQDMTDFSDISQLVFYIATYTSADQVHAQHSSLLNTEQLLNTYVYKIYFLIMQDI